MTTDMATMLAKKFIQRQDAKAVQNADGEYMPVADWIPKEGGGYERGTLHPFQMDDLHQHLAGTKTFGHYLLDAASNCKLFAFDIDLEKFGSYSILPDLTNMDPDYEPDERTYRSWVKTEACSPRTAWLDRSHPGRSWLKWQLRQVAEKLSRTVFTELEIPTAVAYSGSKGVHVYGFLPRDTPATSARDAAELTLELAGGFEVAKGKNFFRTVDQDPFTGFPNLSIEVFPKQVDLSGKDLGNLMRLPLGRNLKSQDPTFFVDQRAAQGQLVPHPDPIALLESGNPWL